MTIKNGYVQDWSTISSKVIKVYFMCYKSHGSCEVCVPSPGLKPCGLSAFTFIIIKVNYDACGVVPSSFTT